MKCSKKSFGVGLIVSGGILIVITFLGQWSDAGEYKSNPPQNWERFDPALVEKTSDLDSLFRAAEERASSPLEKMPPKEAMKILYKTVIDRFTHGGTANHNLFSNWILWGLGMLHPAFARIVDPDVLLKNGHSAFCSQTSYLLLRMAQKAGIRPRHVGLFGHVVMEAWYEGDWHLYDPDLEVAAENEKGSVLSVEELSWNKELVLKVYAGRGEDSYIKKIAGIITSREDNTFMSYPIGSHFVWKKQVLAEIEKTAEVFKFVIPGLLILVGIAFLLGKRRKSV